MGDYKYISSSIEHPLITKKPVEITDFNFDPNAPIGKGGFCSVYEAIYIPNGKLKFALKIIDKSQIKSENEINSLKCELEIMEEINGFSENDSTKGNLLKIITTFEDEINLYIVLPLCKNGQLFDYINPDKLEIRGRNKPNKKVLKKYIFQSINAIKLLHENGIMHRDIKPENILIDEDDNAVLCDFGIAAHYKFFDKGKWINFKRDTLCGTKEYLAPEVIRGQKYDEKIDIWAIGVLLCEVMSVNGQIPFAEDEFIQTDGNKKFLIENDKDFRVNLEPEFDFLLRDLLKRIFKINPESRLSIDDILTHSFFDDVDLSAKNEEFISDRDSKVTDDIIFETGLKSTFDSVVEQLSRENEVLKEKYNKVFNELTALSSSYSSLSSSLSLSAQQISSLKSELDSKNSMISSLISERIFNLAEGETTLKMPSEEDICYKKLYLDTFEKEKSRLLECRVESFGVCGKRKERRVCVIQDSDNFFIDGKQKEKSKEENNESENEEFNLQEFIKDYQETKKKLQKNLYETQLKISKHRSFIDGCQNTIKEALLEEIRNLGKVLDAAKKKAEGDMMSFFEKMSESEIEGKEREILRLKEEIEKLNKKIFAYEQNCASQTVALNNKIATLEEENVLLTKEIEAKEKLISVQVSVINDKTKEIEVKNGLIENYEISH